MKLKHLIMLPVLALLLLSGCARNVNDFEYPWPLTFSIEGRYPAPSSEMLVQVQDNAGNWNTISSATGDRLVTGSAPVINDPNLGTWYSYQGFFSIPLQYITYTGNRYKAVYRVINKDTGIQVYHFPSWAGEWGQDCFINYANTHPGTTIQNFLTVVGACGGVNNRTIYFANWSPPFIYR